MRPGDTFPRCTYAEILTLIRKSVYRVQNAFNLVLYIPTTTGIRVLNNKSAYTRVELFNKIRRYKYNCGLSVLHICVLLILCYCYNFLYMQVIGKVHLQPYTCHTAR
jgi:hypothetical protein